MESLFWKGDSVCVLTFKYSVKVAFTPVSIDHVLDILGQIISWLGTSAFKYFAPPNNRVLLPPSLHYCPAQGKYSVLVTCGKYLNQGSQIQVNTGMSTKTRRDRKCWLNWVAVFVTCGNPCSESWIFPRRNSRFLWHFPCPKHARKPFSTPTHRHSEDAQ